MKNNRKFVFAVFFVAIIVCYLLFLPETLRRLEGDDFFVFTSTFLYQKLGEAPGLSSWLQSFLLQFFRFPWLAAFILSFFLTGVGWLCSYIPNARNRKGFEELGVLLPIALVCLVPLCVNVFLQVFFFFALLVVGFRIRRLWLKMVYVLLVSALGFLLLAWPLLVFCILVIMADALLLGHEIKKQAKYVIPVWLISLLICVGDVWFSNEYLLFIPFDKRFWLRPDPSISCFVLCLVLLVSVALMFLPRWKFKRWPVWGGTCILSVLILVSACSLGVRNDLRYSEDVNVCARLADEHQWDELLSVSSQEKYKKNKLFVCYALMAESGKEKLTERFLNYSIGTGEDFLFRHSKQKNSLWFNRQFYDHLGIYDEAFRYAFEYGVMTQEGFCFASLRYMTHYAVLTGNFQVAEKYLNLLSLSTLHHSWVKRVRQFIEEGKKQKFDTPLIQDTYTNIYPMYAELLHEMDFAPGNQPLMDYLFCGLLLDRQLGQMVRLLRETTFYRHRPLPTSINEAIAVVSTNPELDVREEVNYDKYWDEQFAQFYEKMKTADDLQKLEGYKGSYWTYYFLLQRVPIMMSRDAAQMVAPQMIPVN